MSTYESRYSSEEEYHEHADIAYEEAREKEMEKNEKLLAWQEELVLRSKWRKLGLSFFVSVVSYWREESTPSIPYSGGAHTMGQLKARLANANIVASRSSIVNDFVAVELSIFTADGNYNSVSIDYSDSWKGIVPFFGVGKKND